MILDLGYFAQVGDYSVLVFGIFMRFDETCDKWKTFHMIRATFYEGLDEVLEKSTRQQTKKHAAPSNSDNSRSGPGGSWSGPEGSW